VKIDLSIDVDPADLGAQLSRKVLSAMASAVDESLRYGSFGRAVKEATDAAVLSIVRGVVSDPTFRANAHASLAMGLLRGVEARGEKIARGIPLQQAIDLAGALRAPVSPGASTGGEGKEGA
jgi:hypothetical protein